MKRAVSSNPNWREAALSLQSIRVTDVNEAAGDYVVDVEIQDSGGTTVAGGKAYSTQHFDRGQAQEFPIPNPSLSTGTYNVDVGIFDPSKPDPTNPANTWGQRLLWDTVATYTVE